MKLMIKQNVKNILKDKCWMRPNAWEQLDIVFEDMMLGMANRLEKNIKADGRRIAISNDIVNAYNEHREAYAYPVIAKSLEQIIGKLERTKKEKEMFYGI